MHLHIKSFTTTKFQDILFSSFRGVGLTNCFKVYFIFVKFSKFINGVILRKKKRIRISCRYAHLHGMSFTTTKFQDILFSGFRGVALTNCFSRIFHSGQISNKKKKGVTLRKKIESKFHVDMHIDMVCPSQLQSFKIFCLAVSEELFQSIIHFGQIFKFINGVILRKK